MIITKFVIYRGRIKNVEDLSPTCGYKVEVECPQCGEHRVVYYRSIMSAGHCICQLCIMKNSRKFIEIGTRFGKLTVIAPSDRIGYSICKCDCGKKKEIDNFSLSSGKTKSCGCLRSENFKTNFYQPKGKEHWNWKGGITGERNLIMSKKAYKDWRSAVFERDNYTCKKCGQVGYKLNAHHIYDFSNNPDIRLELDNGITFCNNCHKEFHSVYGFLTNEEQLGEFICEKDGELLC